VLAEVLKLGGRHFAIPGAFQGAQSLGELGGVGLAQVALGVALHVNDAQLDVSLGKQAPGNRQQAREIVVDDQQETA